MPKLNLFVTHVQKEVGAETRIMELQGNENLLGVLSSQGTLYIFENWDIMDKNDWSA